MKKSIYILILSLASIFLFSQKVNASTNIDVSVIDSSSGGSLVLNEEALDIESYVLEISGKYFTIKDDKLTKTAFSVLPSDYIKQSLIRAATDNFYPILKNGTSWRRGYAVSNGQRVSYANTPSAGGTRNRTVTAKMGNTTYVNWTLDVGRSVDSFTTKSTGNLTLDLKNLSAESQYNISVTL